MMKVTKENKIKALRATRVFIAREDETFICHALSHVIVEDPNMGRVCMYLKGYISRELYPHGSLYQWLVGQSRSTEHMIQYKLQWIDWMIENMT